jgi:hypothetical protein
LEIISGEGRRGICVDRYHRVENEGVGLAEPLGLVARQLTYNHSSVRRA